MDQTDLINPPKTKTKIAKQLPLIVLENIVIFPRIVLPLLIKRPESLAALNYALKGDHLVVFVVAKKEKLKERQAKDLYNVGTVSRILQMLKMPDDSAKVIVEGIKRVKIKEFVQTKPFFKVKTAAIKSKGEQTLAIKALIRSILSQFKQCVNLGKIIPLEVMLAIFNTTNPDQLVDLIVLNLDLSVEERQSLLQSFDIQRRLQKLNTFLAREIEILKTGKKLREETTKELGKMSREVFLRQQLKSIEKELGVSEGEDEIIELKQKIKKAGMPKEVRKVAHKELKRLEKMPSFSPEVSYIRTYLDWLTDLPWSRKSNGQVDIKKAEKILDEDHYGLEKVKERVLEYLAVQKMVGKIKGPILCFVGPPGTGKTSIGQSIARALDRKFFRMSLGGIRDEAEIRGHRRTYVGALPGRIIQGINTAGTKNPVFMLDEIDKVGADFRGDPSSALLEALDPEQNFNFSDHYLEVPFDLSDVMFITTANILDTIPPALRDRMEVINFPGYTEDEKFHIAKKYLLPKLFESHGLKGKNLNVRDPALRTIIEEYTREAGVRNLERELAKICRKIIRRIAEGSKKSCKIGINTLKKYLGPAKYHLTLAEKKNEIGVATGLAWTEAGGEILEIEATKMPGKGQLLLTGHLGEVMKESATAALSYARSKAKSLNIDEKFYKNQDVHVHVPAGAIPKDGPSAGIAIATALASVLSGRAVKREVAMTGEVTLRGQVLEIGGVKEKVLAAHRGGAKEVILPQENKKNLDDIPKDVQDELKFKFVDHMDDVLKEALVRKEVSSKK